MKLALENRTRQTKEPGRKGKIRLAMLRCFSFAVCRSDAEPEGGSNLGADDFAVIGSSKKTFFPLFCFSFFEFLGKERKSLLLCFTCRATGRFSGGGARGSEGGDGADVTGGAGGCCSCRPGNAVAFGRC